jgi:hypothetical protein
MAPLARASTARLMATAKRRAIDRACSIGFSARLNRWYWHSERSTDLSTITEHLGTCDATWTASAP